MILTWYLAMAAVLIFAGTRGELDIKIFLLWLGFIGIVTVVRESFNILVVEEIKPNE